MTRERNGSACDVVSTHFVHVSHVTRALMHDTAIKHAADQSAAAASVSSIDTIVHVHIRNCLSYWRDNKECAVQHCDVIETAQYSRTFLNLIATPKHGHCYILLEAFEVGSYVYM